MEERVPLLADIEERRLDPREDLRNARLDDVPDGECRAVVLHAKLDRHTVLSERGARPSARAANQQFVRQPAPPRSRRTSGPPTGRPTTPRDPHAPGEWPSPRRRT